MERIAFRQFIILPILFLMLLPVSLAETSFCYNATHRQIDREVNIIINDTIYNIKSSELEYCPYGCVEETGLCRQPTYMQVIIVIVLFIVGGIVYLIIRSVR